MGAAGIAAQKARLRARMRERLAAEPAAERQRRSDLVVAALEALPEVRGARALLVPRSLPTEVALDGLLGAAVLRGQLTFVPRVEGPELCFLRVEPETRWRRSTLGVLEPEAGERFRVDEVAAGGVVVVVPGLAFDAAGRRLGRGGGHYDRFLVRARAAGPLRVLAAAFDLQIVARVPTEDHDQRVDRIVTESRMV